METIIKKTTVNWVKDDEELLQPYEWEDYDDIEKLTDVPILYVLKTTFYDLYYSIIKTKNLDDSIFIASDGEHCIAVEIVNNMIAYRSTIQIEHREVINTIAKKQKITKIIDYSMIETTDISERYNGLTRKERLLKND